MPRNSHKAGSAKTPDHQTSAAATAGVFFVQEPPMSRKTGSVTTPQDQNSAEGPIDNPTGETWEYRQLRIALARYSVLINEQRRPLVWKEAQGRQLDMALIALERLSDLPGTPL